MKIGYETNVFGDSPRKVLWPPLLAIFPENFSGVGFSFSSHTHTRGRDIGVALPARVNKRLNAAGPDVWWVGFLAGGGYRRSGCVVDGIPLRMHFSKD